MNSYSEKLSKRLTTQWAARRVCYFEETDSTNLRAKLAAIQGEPHGALFVADKQTAGRGRKGRDWESPPGKNLYFTILLKPDFVPDKASMVTLVMGLAVTEVIRTYCNIDAMIKWPNDVVVGGRKVCGILTELGLNGRAVDYLIVGVGINVESQEFPTYLADTATCIEAESLMKADREELLARIMNRFEELYEIFVRDVNLKGLQQPYNDLLINRDRKVRVLDPQGEYTGIARGITETGDLLVERPNGQLEAVFAGEVSVRGVYGYV